MAKEEEHTSTTTTTHHREDHKKGEGGGKPHTAEKGEAAGTGFSLRRTLEHKRVQGAVLVAVLIALGLLFVAPFIPAQYAGGVNPNQPPPTAGVGGAVIADPCPSHDLATCSGITPSGAVPGAIPGFVPAGPGGQAVAVTAASYTTSSSCPGETKVVDLDSTPQVINPRALCVVKWQVDVGEVDLIDRAGNTLTVGPQGGNFAPFWTESVRAAGGVGTASMHYKLTTS